MKCSIVTYKMHNTIMTMEALFMFGGVLLFGDVVRRYKKSNIKFCDDVALVL